MNLHQKQKEIVQSDKRYKLLNWGRRSGKTTVIGYEIFQTLWNTEGLVSYYAPTRDDARDIAWEIYRDILAPITLKTNETFLEITVKNSKGTTSLLRMSGWEAVKNRDKGRGVENNLLVLDECAFYPSFKDKFEKVLEPTLLTSRGKLIIASTPNGFNHFYELANKARSSDDWLYSHATSYDNPANLVGEIERLKKEKTEDAFSQEYLADFRKMEGLVYKDFKREKHIFYGAWEEKAKGFDKLIGTVDFGFTNPAAVLSIVKDRDKKYFIIDEWYHTRRTDDDIADYTASKSYNLVYPDPESASGCETLKRKGVNIREVNKGKDSVRNGISIVSELFRANRLFIHESCTNLIWELETYSYPEKKDNQNENENPIKENDHALDSMRYGLMMEEGKPVFTMEASPAKTLNYYPELNI